jgi:hypothetical protein
MLRASRPPFSEWSTATSVIPPVGWSEGAEGSLVSNLSAHERTRQEVLWEVIASEERYVPSALRALRCV